MGADDPPTRDTPTVWLSDETLIEGMGGLRWQLRVSCDRRTLHRRRRQRRPPVVVSGGGRTARCAPGLPRTRGDGRRAKRQPPHPRLTELCNTTPTQVLRWPPGETVALAVGPDSGSCGFFSFHGRIDHSVRRGGPLGVLGDEARQPPRLVERDQRVGVLDE